MPRADGADRWDAASGAAAFEDIVAERMLGLGAAAQDFGEDMEAFYRDEQEFRVML